MDISRKEDNDHKELITRLPDELQTEIRAAAKSAIDVYYARLIDRKQRELQDLEHERQRALETWLHEEIDSDDSLEVPQVQETTTPTSRREMVLAVLPDFSDPDFIRRDVEARIVERWPEVEPKTKVESKNFTSGIAAVMTDLVKKGQLEVRKGVSRFEPRVYRLKDI
jgi:hypothetical protein